MSSIRQQKTDLDRYLLLRELREKDENLFYRVLMTNAQELLPHVYTPTVGEACQKYSKLPIKTHGIILTPADKGKILDKLKAWPEKDIRVIVATDGERILGLGDLGYNGMGISEGKILLYSIIAGVDPQVCLPIGIDVGTNNQSLLDEPEYKGLRQRRLRGPEYEALIDELLTAVRALPSHVLFQFEDFGNTTAFKHLAKYRGVQCCFNDDIQGTACITLAGILSALRVTKQPLGAQQRVLFLGAGEAGTGIAELIAMAIVKRTGIPIEEARKACFFMDSKGLVCKSRLAELQHHKIPFAHDIPYQSSLVDTIKTIRPTVLIGASTMAGAFTKEVVELMCEINERPIIFPLSNPTSKAECTYKDAFEWSKGKVVFASGSPFAPLVAADGTTHYPAQANNAYVFGPIGMAALLTNCKYITDEVFMETAEVLAELSPHDKLEQGMLFPLFTEIKNFVAILIGKTAEFIVNAGLAESAEASKVSDWIAHAKQAMFQPLPGRVPHTEIKEMAAPVIVEKDVEELVAMRKQPTDLDRYLYVRHLQDNQPERFFKLLMHHAQELLPYVYTPTVGEACQKYHKLPFTTRGMYIRPENRGHILEMLKAWPHQDIKVVVVTDGERILGLGDQGAGGMGISEGKILLYTAMAGVNPSNCLPVTLDVGTNRETLLEDPEYKGLREKRLRGPAYDELVHEFVTALYEWQPHLLLQFEDFGNCNAFRLLDRYRPDYCSFNDDIQGTACVVLAGLVAGLRVTGRPLDQQKVLFLGAGEAGVGIGDLIAMAMVQKHGLSIEEARKHCFYVDSKGLVCKSRTDLQAHKVAFAHDIPFQPSLLEAVKAIRPTAIIGVSTIAGAFTEEIVRLMADINERPIVFPLSNPTSKAECTYVDAMAWTDEKVVFASGSPFPSLVGHVSGHTFYPAQANNAYVFGPIGMAAVLTKCKCITDGVFLKAADVLGSLTPESRLQSGMLFPAFSDMKVVSPQLIAQLCEYILETGLGTEPEDKGDADWLSYVKSKMFTPEPFPRCLVLPGKAAQ
ncbi:hypothetical protein CBR_g3078 [Chara braunii]|uniref:Malic enzyme n=1 Tax=Chara braunii TaxID=69332 RepID=A0A388KEQ1_CHABU|nr:hypothetical protein CBR_g3078 [Chara braunii]|eukprot:GBG68534.1 hypothetical protein CBR_g3078 [Chara braunii]